MTELYAICRGATFQVKHVRLNQQVSAQIAGMFDAQEVAFNSDVTAEIDFTGDWKPDEDELLVIRNLPEAHSLLQAAAQNAISLPPLDVANFQSEGVKALFVRTAPGPNPRLLIQYFSPQQFLSARFSVLYDGNVFRRIIEPAFTLNSQLVATVDSAGDVRFKSFSTLRRILDVTPVFRAATDVELANFCAHASLSVPNAAAFAAGADEVIRKHVMAITKAGVLDNVPVQTIAAQAAAIGFQLTVTATGQLDVPQDRGGAKALFSFLLNKVYRGPINQQLFITNSNRLL